MSVIKVNVINIARVLIDSRNEMTEMQFAKTLFAYSANLSAVTATLVTNVCLSKSQMAELMSEIDEFEELGKSIV